ncbi:hypothetical protein [Streptomyces melanogenes]|uniref:Secreted protein n=1 Tax=Streptomyces melanogenes TaxID=67326 RepID=A0ABZ1XPT6_9ACTN|nr:hypothetical protein [Streptomyces melanogenes]
MRSRVLFAFAAAALTALATVAPTATAAAAPTASGVSEVATALKKAPVYVDPGAAGQLSPAQADALAKKIKDADKPLFVAVLPATAAFPKDTLLRNLRTDTGVTGLYAVRLGDAFNAGADRKVMSAQAVDNLKTAVRAPGTATNASTQLNAFVDQALPSMRGHAPASWGGGSSEKGGVSTTALITTGAVVVAGGAGAYALVRRSRKKKAEEERAALQRLQVVVDEDITAFGEELDRLDFHPAEAGADDAMRADYERALDSYETAKTLMAAARHPGDVRGVTQALEDGRYSLAVLAARREHRPLPERRAPCFFDPRHGPSVEDATWSPAGGAPRQVPVCLADATRLRDGRDPLVREVDTDGGRRPYYDAGPAYGPWAGGYFGGGILPGLLMGTMLGSMLSTPAYAADYGGADFAGQSYDGGDVSGSDFNPSDFGGGWGDGGGGGGDGGGFDGGGGW